MASYWESSQFPVDRSVPTVGGCDTVSYDRASSPRSPRPFGRQRRSALVDTRARPATGRVRRSVCFGGRTIRKPDRLRHPRALHIDRDRNGRGPRGSHKSCPSDYSCCSPLGLEVCARRLLRCGMRYPRTSDRASSRTGTIEEYGARNRSRTTHAESSTAGFAAPLAGTVQRNVVQGRSDPQNLMRTDTIAR